MTDVVVFDLFGVIAQDQSPDVTPWMVTAAGVPAHLFWSAYWTARPRYDRGEVAGQDYWLNVAQLLNATFSEHQVDQLIALDIASWARIDDNMVVLLHQLADSTRLALLSNIPPEIADHYDREQPWLTLFDVRAFSCRIGLAKPDPKAYLWCCEALHVEPHHATFIDDRAENVATAQATGMTGHLFTSRGDLTRYLNWTGPA